MAADLLIGATAGLSRQELGQRYLDVYKARDDAFELPTINDFEDLQESLPSFTGNRLIDKAAQLVLDLESVDQQTGILFEQNSEITDIIKKYEEAANTFGKLGPDEDVRERLSEILSELESSENLEVDEEV